MPKTHTWNPKSDVGLITPMASLLNEVLSLWAIHQRILQLWALAAPKRRRGWCIVHSALARNKHFHADPVATLWHNMTGCMSSNRGLGCVPPPTCSTEAAPDRLSLQVRVKYVQNKRGYIGLRVVGSSPTFLPAILSGPLPAFVDMPLMVSIH